MGWGSGAEVFSGIIKAAKKYFPDAEKRKEFYADVYPAFSDHDWDTESDCFQDDPVFEEWYCTKTGTLPQRKQHELAIQIFQNDIKKKELAAFPVLTALGLKKKYLKELIEEIWYYVEELQEDGIEIFKQRYEC